MPQNATYDPIAIIGMSCRFPGIAKDLDGFWKVLAEGLQILGDIPPARFDITNLAIRTNKGAFIEEVAAFDAKLFNISPREATALDPQQRILLECTWHALENAGIDPQSLNNSKTGVFIGNCNDEYKNILENAKDVEKYKTLIATSSFLSATAGRISYTFGLVGPSITVDTHYSSSLTALHLACQSLHENECEQAIVGGVHLVLSPEEYIIFSDNKTLAPDGTSKAFDKDANGFGKGEGCGVIVIKRLDDALKNGDRIGAVICATAVNQDGHSISMTAPNTDSQQALIAQGLAQANLAPANIGYIEAHGTGTKLGDMIEAHTIREVFKNQRVKPLYVGSVKTNIGHLGAASGMAGLIKVVLALKHKQIPAHLHLKELNPQIDFNSIPAVVPNKLTEWFPINNKRTACINSYGLTGSNAVAVITEAPASDKKNVQQLERDAHILMISSKTSESLKALALKYQNLFATSAENIADICYSANVGRAQLEKRLAIIGRNNIEVAEHINAWMNGQDCAGVIEGNAAKKIIQNIAFLFAGDSCQYVGMGKELYATNIIFKQAIDACAELLKSYWQDSLYDILWNDNQLIAREEYVQPALFAIEYGLAMIWNSWGIKPSVVYGHGLGKYVAAVISGVFTLEDGLRLLVKGPINATKIKYCTPQIAIISNTTGELCTADEVCNAEYWSNQTAEAIKFDAIMQTFVQLNVEHLVEIGAHPVLYEIFSKNIANFRERNLSYSTSLINNKNDWEALLEGLAKLFVSGIHINWTKFDNAYSRNKVNVPTYCFEHKDYWVGITEDITEDAVIAELKDKK